MPGTVTSALGLLICVWLDAILPLDFLYRTLFLFIIFFTFFFLSWGFLKILFPHKSEDFSWITLDEFLGMMIAVGPLFFIYDTGFWWFVGFGLFRVFDILKPLGIGFIDKKNTSLSILLDDIVAGGYSAIVLLAFWYVAG
ncbi:phosphatidylglycerophosphatase A [Candidatus Gracilibacteria bacterium]|nr:phosphatidylglycerophosphatase A [Candidatus Gracilibacteria bacterium]